MRSCYILETCERWNACHEAALERIGTAAPRQHSVLGRSKKPGTRNKVLSAACLQVSEDIAPATITQQRGREPALAVAKAFGADNADIFRGRGQSFGCKKRPGARVGVCASL